MARLRLLLLGLSLFVLVWADGWIPSRVFAQVAPAPRPGFATRDIGQGGLNLADSWLRKNLLDIEKKLADPDGDFASVAQRIQQLLTQPQDGFCATNDASGRFYSLKRRAATLLQDAPPAVRESYELQFGAEAHEKLDLARSRQDAKLAQEVTQRFLQTKAGAEACYWLACQYMDQADYFTAVQYLNRLRSLSAGNRFEPRLSLRLGICWYRLGLPDKALASIQDVLKISREPIRVGAHALDKKASGEQIQAWLQAISKGVEKSLVSAVLGWQLARGTPDRNPRRQSSPPVAKPLWSVVMNSWQTMNRRTLKPEIINVAPQLTSLKLVHADAALTPLPSTIPLVVNGLVVTRYSDHLAAVDIRTGEEVWNTFERDRTFHEIRNSLDSTSQISSPYNNYNGDFRDAYKILLRQRAWEDLTYGTLSCDGEHVFAVEDLGFVNPIVSDNSGQKAHPLALKDYNRLCAYDVRSGMLRWELGGPNTAIKLDQAGAFFLGPPLPAGHQLYCLIEKQGFVQLLALDARSGKELWSQNLTQSNEDLLMAPHRRRAGLTPAMMGDLLVCPTGTGYAVAVDTGTRSLAWAYQYTAPRSEMANPNVRFMGRRFGMVNGGMPVDFNSERAAITNEWQDASPILTETHVILTPRDSNELHCLLLEDGALQWKVPRGEGQYIASVRDGAVVVVNKHSVEALKLTDGKPAWASPIPVINQTGRGITTQTHLVLPLVNGQVVSIELKTAGKFYSRVRSANQEPLGNLVPAPGMIISQTPSELAAFRTLEAVYPEALQRLAVNPQDAEALAQRGEYRLSLSRIAEGQADLRESIRIKPSADAEFLLFESLLEGLQSNFKTHRNLALEAEKLAHLAGQKSELYRVWAEGLRKLGEFQPAFDLLAKLNAPALGKPDMERVDGFHSIRRDYWVRNELRLILATASQPDQQRFLSILKTRLDAAKSTKNEDDLRQLTRFLGWGAMADEARLALAEQLADKEYSLEVEQLLASLRQHPDPRISGKAIALMIFGMIKLDRGSEAASLIQELERTHADVVCLPNKTGKQLAAEWHKTISMHVGSFEDWPTGRVDLAREVLEKSDIRVNLDIPIDAERGPFYRDAQLRFESGAQRFLGLTGWGTARFAMPLSELLPITNTMVLHAQVRNHLILLNTGLNVVAIDTLTDGKTIRARRIWSSPLIDAPASDENQVYQQARFRAGIGRPRMMGMDRWQNVIGMVNCVQDDSLCVIRGRHLVLLDILTGETLWKRTDMTPGSELLGDAETVYVISPQSAVARKFRRADGAAGGETPVAPALNRIQFLGNRILSSNADPLAGGLILKLSDLALEKTVWERPYPLGTQVSLVGDAELAVLEPSGQLSYFQISDGKLLWTQQLPQLVKRRDFSVVLDGPRLLVLRDEGPPPNLQQQVIAVNAMQQNLMYGQADCVDRQTGKMLW
ncbi:MAG: Pyrrolo-quinoline quinone [Planctomycetaceae bacterium]|nr:Pyrrolo-quinoline quinone [Planctomycetaceae bacterium]